MKKSIEIGTVVVLLIGATMISRGLIMHYNRPKTDPKLYQTLNAEKTTELDRLEALITLAKAQDRIALKSARNWVNTDNDFYQSGGVIALSYYPDKDVLADMKKILPTLEEHVRLKALNAFAANPTAERKKWLEELTRSPDVFVEVAARLFLLTYERDAKALEAGLDGLFVDFERLEHLSQGRLIDYVATKFGSQEVTKKWLVSLTKSSHPISIQVSAIRKLTASDSSDLEGQISNLVRNPAAEVRAAAIEAIPHVCPQGYWGILQEEAKTEPNMLVLRRVLDVLSDLKGQNAQNVLKVVKARDGKLSKDMFTKIAEAEKDLAAAPKTNRCDSAAKL